MSENTENSPILKTPNLSIDLFYNYILIKEKKLKGVCLYFVEKYHTVHTCINVEKIDLKNVQIQSQLRLHSPTSLTNDD